MVQPGDTSDTFKAFIKNLKNYSKYIFWLLIGDGVIFKAISGNHDAEGGKFLTSPTWKFVKEPNKSI